MRTRNELEFIDIKTSIEALQNVVTDIQAFIEHYEIWQKDEPDSATWDPSDNFGDYLDSQSWDKETFRKLVNLGLSK